MKRILILVMLICSVCFAELKPVLVRDKFTSGVYSVFVPADKDGDNWTKWILSNPIATRPDIFAIHQVFYGKVYTGKMQTYADKAAGDITSTAALEGWNYVTTSTAAKYLSWTIPAGHNRIHLLGIKATSVHIGSVDILLDNATAGLDVTTVNLNGSGSTGVTEYVIATDCNNGSPRTLKVTAAASTDTNHRVALIGIKSFNTLLTAEPNEAASGISVGNDIITVHTTDGNPFKYLPVAVTGLSEMAMYYNTCEFTINWKPDAESTYKWTGYGEHASAGNAIFTPTANPDLFINGVLIGDMNSVAVVPLGTTYEANSITQIAQGYGAWDEDDHELNIKLNQSWSQSGVGIGVYINLTGDIDLGDCYIPSILVPNDATGWVKILPDNTEIAIGTDWPDKHGSMIQTLYDGADFMITANSLGPISSIFENSDPAYNKIYMNVNAAVMGLSNGSNWSSGAFINISSLSSFGDWAGYSWPTADNIKKGETAFDGSTTITGTYNPARGWLR